MDRRLFLRVSVTAALYGGLSAACRQLPVFSHGTAAGEFARLDATAQSGLFKSGDVSSTELVEAAIERIEEVDSKLNSVVYRNYEHAREQAARATREDGVFAGVPYLLKCLEAKQGMPLTQASRFFADNIAEESDPVTVAAESSGLIYIGNSNAPEFGTIASTEPTLYGPSNNPWDLTRSPGGSSGGSGVAVAAGLVPIATADDGGGSIRIPASFCGIVGLKPSRSREVGHEESFYVNTGCHSRSVRDTAAFLNATERKNHPELSPVGMIGESSNVRLKVAYSSVGIRSDTVIDGDVKASVSNVAALLDSLGHHVEEKRFDIDGDEFWSNFWIVWSQGVNEFLSMVRERLGREPNDREFEPWTRFVMSKAVGLTSEHASAAMAYFTSLRARHREFLNDYDIQLTPVMSTPPFQTGHQNPRDTDFEKMNRRVEGDVNFTPLQNATGMPAITLPLNWTSSNLPCSPQFCADWGQEAKLLRLAYELEQANPWTDRWPPNSASA